jgi:hypothetical protein
MGINFIADKDATNCFDFAHDNGKTLQLNQKNKNLEAREITK